LRFLDSVDLQSWRVFQPGGFARSFSQHLDLLDLTATAAGLAPDGSTEVAAGVVADSGPLEHDALPPPQTRSGNQQRVHPRHFCNKLQPGKIPEVLNKQLFGSKTYEDKLVSFLKLRFGSNRPHG
jgi:hypothetical protein